MRRLMRYMGMAAVTVMSSTAPLAAAQLTTEPRLVAGLSHYNLDLDDEIVVGGDSVNNIEYSDWLYLIGGGLTFSYERFFVDVYGQYSFNGEDSLNIDAVVGGVAVNNLAQDIDFDRIETALTVGYRVTDRIATFVGFRYADVDFEGSGSIGAATADFSTDFKQKGPFLGVGYVVPEAISNSAFVVNAAVAYLDGDLKNKLEADAPLADTEFDINGDAIGVNAGASWVKPLTKQLKLVIGADVSWYRFQDNEDQTDFDELVTRLRTELRYGFDIGSVGLN